MLHMDPDDASQRRPGPGPAAMQSKEGDSSEWLRRKRPQFVAYLGRPQAGKMLGLPKSRPCLPWGNEYNERN